MLRPSSSSLERTPTGSGSTGDLATNRAFVETYGITFTMLLSDSPVPTNYYHFPAPAWSSFWLLDSTGRRVLGAVQFESDLVGELLDLLF